MRALDKTLGEAGQQRSSDISRGKRSEKGEL